MPAAKIKTQNWWKVPLPCISVQRNVEFAGTSTCCGVFRLLRLRFLETSPFNCASSQWLELICRFIVPAYSSLPHQVKNHRAGFKIFVWVIPLCVTHGSSCIYSHTYTQNICSLCWPRWPVVLGICVACQLFPRHLLQWNRGCCGIWMQSNSLFAKGTVAASALDVICSTWPHPRTPWPSPWVTSDMSRL